MRPVCALKLLFYVVFASGCALALTPSSVTLGTSPNPSAYGKAVTLTASVTSGATGKVTFYDGTTVLGIATISSSQAILSTIMLPSGVRSLRAYYAGDATYAPSTSTVAVQNVKPSASLGLLLAANITGFGFPVTQITGDFDGDGRLDLAVVNGNGSNIVVRLGNGDGTFQPASNYPANIGAGSLSLGDFDGDGHVDLIATTAYGVVILRGNGDGTFQPFTTVVTIPYGHLAVGDFNADGILDLVLATTTNDVEVLLGNGDGTFQPPASYTAPGNCYSVAIGDFNGDGVPDLAVLTDATSGGIGIFLGNGNGSFVASGGVGTNPLSAAAIADLDSDGNSDLVATTGSGYVYVFLGSGKGTFQPIGPFLTSIEAAPIQFADFNGDGILDIVTTGFTSPSVAVLYGIGNGSFQPAVLFSVPASPANSAFPSSPIVGDFNGDGKADVAVLLSDNGVAAILLGGATPNLTIAVSDTEGFTQGQVGARYQITVSNVGTFASAGLVSVVDSLPPGFTATAVSGSGWNCVLGSLTCTRSDALAAGTSYPLITVTVNIGGSVTGSVTNNATVSGGGDNDLTNNAVANNAISRLATITTLSASPNDSALGHPVTLMANVSPTVSGKVTFFDGGAVLGIANLVSGRATLSTSLLPSGSLSLTARFDGNANYGPSLSSVYSERVTVMEANGVLQNPVLPGVTEVGFVSVADFNNDGLPDLVAVGSEGISVSLGKAGGTFQPAVNYTSSGGIVGVVVGDWDGDGKPDLAIYAQGSQTLRTRLGNGNGTFQSEQVGAVNGGAQNLVAADLNGDGVLDLIGTDGSGGIVEFLGNGDGTFQGPVPISISGFNVVFLAVADLNGDGTPDLVLGNSAANSSFYILIGYGDGTFQTGANYQDEAGYESSLVIGDFSGDGKVDVALLHSFGISTFLGNGNGTFQPAIYSSLTDVPSFTVLSGDFDGDGFLDIAYRADNGGALDIAFGRGNGAFKPTITFPSSAYSEEINSPLAQADFNGDGIPDLAVPYWGDGGSMSIFFGAQLSDLLITETHSGRITAGQSIVYQFTVTNPFFVTTSGTVAVTDVLPAGLTVTAMSGSGWNCTVGNATCLRSDALGVGTSYPPISVTVTAASNLQPSTLTNSALVLWNGVTQSIGDPTAIVLAAPTSLAASPNPITLGGSITLTATITSGTSGLITFYDGANVLGSAPISGTHAILTTSMLPVGLRELRVLFPGDSTHGPSRSPRVAVTVVATPSSALVAPVSPSTGAGPKQLAFADLDRDGHVDLVTLNRTDNTVSVLLGNGDGTFQPRVDYRAGTIPIGVIVADLDGDGWPDLVVLNEQLNGAVSFLRNHGNGTFAPALTQTDISPQPGDYPNSFVAADFDGDGKVDLMVAESATFLLIGNGDGTFHPALNPQSIYPADQLAVSDFNGDGIADISANGEIYLGNGDGSFQTPAPYDQVGGSSTVAFGDFNLDGKVDVAGVDGYSALNVALGNGDGSFRSANSYVVGQNALALAVTDIDGDGNLDVVTTNSRSNDLSVWYGSASGALHSKLSYPVGMTPLSVVAADFNGDGRTDLAIANYGSNNITILLGTSSAVLSVTSSHTGSFIFGQTAATYSLLVTNNGPGPTTGTISVTDALPTGLVAATIGGSGWTCTLATVTCTRSDSVGSGVSYAPITLTVDVRTTTSGKVPNLVAVSGDNAPTSFGSDPTLIVLAQPVSQTPSSGTAGRQVFSFVAEDPIEFTYLAYAQFLFSRSGLNAQNACYISYDYAGNVFYLLSDDMTQWYGLRGNSPGTIGNAQCTIYGPTSGGTATSSTNLTINVDISFRSGFAGTKSVYENVGDTSATASGWTQVGTWNDTGDPNVLEITSLSPLPGSGLTQSLTATIKEGSGAANIAFAQLVVNTTLNGYNACFVHYDRPSNVFFLLNDAGTAWDGLYAGSATQVSNSQCTLHGVGSGGVASGSTLTVTYALDFAPGFAGTQQVYMQAADTSGVIEVWHNLGSDNP